jgi:hypothetical protein
MTLKAVLIVSKRLQIVAAAVLCVMLVRLIDAAHEPPARSGAVVRVRAAVDPGRSPQPNRPVM